MELLPSGRRISLSLGESTCNGKIGRRVSGDVADVHGGGGGDEIAKDEGVVCEIVARADWGVWEKATVKVVIISYISIAHVYVRRGSDSGCFGDGGCETTPCKEAARDMALNKMLHLELNRYPSICVENWLHAV